MGCFVVAEFLLTNESRGPSATSEPYVSSGLLFSHCGPVAELLSLSPKILDILCQLNIASLLLPSKVKQRLGRWRNVVVWPSDEVKLGDCTRLVRLQVLEVETANDVIFTPDVLRHQMNLSDTAHSQLSSLLRLPISLKNYQ